MYMLVAGPEKLDYANFVSDGWSREKGERSAVATIQAKEIELRPNVEDDSVSFDTTNLFNSD